MKHRHEGGSHRRFSRSERLPDEGHSERHHHRHGGMGRGGRPFDYGELRLFVLGMIAEQPRHGYELIKAIEEKFSGAYSPSPGVMYPTLAMLDEMGLVALEQADGPRKRYAVTPAGTEHLAAERARLDALIARLGQASHGRAGVPPQILRGMENLKLALRLRLARGALEPAQAEAIAATLDEAARTLERS